MAKTDSQLSPAGVPQGAASYENIPIQKTPGPSQDQVTGRDLAPGMEEKVGQVSLYRLDPESEAFLKLLREQEQVRSRRIAGVKTVLVILSSRGMVFDRESLRQKILLTYPEATVFFGPDAPQQVDLLLDFTGPGQRQPIFYARRLRRLARVAVGRNAGFFRAKIYDRIFDEKSGKVQLPLQPLDRERLVQRKVLELAGIPLAQVGDTPPDRGKTIALQLPPLKRL